MKGLRTAPSLTLKAQHSGSWDVGVHVLVPRAITPCASGFEYQHPQIETGTQATARQHVDCFLGRATPEVGSLV